MAVPAGGTSSPLKRTHASVGENTAAARAVPNISRGYARLSCIDVTVIRRKATMTQTSVLMAAAARIQVHDASGVMEKRRVPPNPPPTKATIGTAETHSKSSHPTGARRGNAPVRARQARRVFGASSRGRSGASLVVTRSVSSTRRPAVARR